MALRGTLTHRKTRRLAHQLGIELPFALGVMEALWHVAAEQQEDGGIGRMSNQDIADEIFYKGDADGLVDILLDCRWLDEMDGCRLYVHDWHVHSDDSTDNKLARHLQRYANGEIPRMKRLSKSERATLCAQYATQSHSAPLPESGVRSQSPESGVRSRADSGGFASETSPDGELADVVHRLRRRESGEEDWAAKKERLLAQAVQLMGDPSQGGSA